VLARSTSEVNVNIGVSAVAEGAELAAEHPDCDVYANSQPSLADLLEQGICRLQKHSTCKLWQWPDGEAFYDAVSLRYLRVPLIVVFSLWHN
jgi:hypothetical protein